VLLGRALEYNHTLQLLNLAYNAIGDEGAMAIGQALKVSRST
jgi:Leucine Rich repeat